VIDEHALLDYIIKQRSTIAAIILRNLNGDKCASILAMTDSEFSRSVLLEMSRMSPPSSDIIDMISDAIEKELLAPIAGKPALGDAGAIVGDIINNLPAEKRDELLEQLVEADQEIGNEVRKAVLTFEELHERLPGAAAPLLLREVDRDILMKALKYAGENAPQTLEFLLGNISKRMAEQYREELEEMAELNTDDGEKAQRQVTSVVKRLAKSAELKLAPAS
ncbi:MAG: FliG C-terminal domain-containing protein, partial [Pseudomonadota bacterium]